MEHLMLYQLNKIRKEHNLLLCTLNDKLGKAAHEHAENMCLRKFFSHVDSKLGNPEKRAKKAGFRGNNVSENIAKGQVSVESVFEDWMNSPGHKTQIMNPSYNVVGFGFWLCETQHKGYISSKTYFVNQFGCTTN